MSFRFLDGPAAKVADGLCCRRAPIWLRVVFDGRRWDCLDLLDDFADPAEQVWAYVRVGGANTVHLRRDAAHGGSGWFTFATYELAPEQPPDDVLRDNDRWREWVLVQVGEKTT